ncbi:MAG: BRCT domain-containing protein [Reichenbachiella sp.]
MAKSASSLKGILEGVIADDRLTLVEIEFLQLWADEQENLCGDFLDISDAIARVLKEGIITNAEKDELLSLIEDCVQYSPKFEQDKELMNQYIEFLKGITVDDVVDEKEFDKLVVETCKLSHMFTVFPLNIVQDKILELLSTNCVEPKDLKELCEMIKEICGTDFMATDDALGGATRFFCDNIESFSGRNVCITGKFLQGPRTEVASILEGKGARIHKNVNKETDVVIIGALESRDWINSSSGRKIERAHALREQGSGIQITCEQVSLVCGY